MADAKNQWEGGEEVQSNWFKFTNPGDKVKGTLLGFNHQEATIEGYQDQWVYDLLQEDGTKIKFGISDSKSKKGTNDRLQNCKVGEIIGVLFEKLGEPKKGFKPAKYLKIFTFGQDPEFAVTEAFGADAAPNMDDVPFA